MLNILRLQKTRHNFELLVQKNFDFLVDEFKNVTVICLRSGKLTAKLNRNFLDAVMLPYV